MALLSKYVCFRSLENCMYLRYNNDATETRSLVRFDGRDEMDPYAQFEVVEAKIGGGLVHIKCTHNSLYLVRWSPSHYWISASAHEPQEEKTAWACTLFKPVLIQNPEDGKKIRLLHVQSERYVRLPSSSVSAPYVSCLLADSKESNNHNSFDILIANNMIFPFKLPRRVAFRGDNELYLGARLIDGRPGLQFSFKDVKDPKVAHQVITFPDGTVSIKSEYYGSFWRVERDTQNNYIVVDADGPNPNGAHNLDTGGTFRVNQIRFNYIGLLSMNPTSYLKRMNGPDIGWMNSIGAATQDMNTSACIIFVDLERYGPSLQETTDLPTNLPTDLPTNISTDLPETTDLPTNIPTDLPAI